MSTPKLLSLALLFSLLAAFSKLTPMAAAQEVTASIVGTITDPSGAPIPGAAVVATDSDRGTVWNAKTTDAGTYNIPRLPVGNYTVRVSANRTSTMRRSTIRRLRQELRTSASP